MIGKLATCFTLVLFAAAAFGLATPARAEDPKPAPKSEAKAAPQSAEQVSPAGAEKPADSPLSKPMPRPARPKALNKQDPTPPAEPTPLESKSSKSLVSPAGLLSIAPTVVPFSPPGLGKLDLNAPTTTIEQIQRLPGVGVVWAPRILAGRPYRTFGEMARDGIPFTTIEALSRSVELGP